MIDCNNFYASCERVFNPLLRNRPVVVLSNNDGCVIARSEEAKAIGIKMGEPAFNARALIESHNVAVFSSNFALYGDMSHRVMSTLTEIVPEIEIYSIDEAFVNFDGLQYFDLKELGMKMRRTVIRNTGIPISIGIAPTKTLAKLGSRMAKKNPSYEGVCYLEDPEVIREALSKLDVDDVWGIGRQYSKMLRRNKIFTALDFTKSSDEWIRRNMSVMGLRVKKELSGISCIPIEKVHVARKAICTARSFGTMVSELDQLRESVSTFAGSCARKLRQDGTCANLVMVFVHTNRFREDDPQYAKNMVVRLPVATHSTFEIVKYANIALERIFRKGYKYKKAGVIVSGIVPDTQVQTGLFDKVDRDRHEKLMGVMDKMNETYGRNTVKLAIQGTGRKWKLRQEQLSPAYTSDWNEILVIKA